jgi:hypothetical protein
MLKVKWREQADAGLQPSAFSLQPLAFLLCALSSPACCFIFPPEKGFSEFRWKTDVAEA